jgi:hypothetical protein
MLNGAYSTLEKMQHEWVATGVMWRRRNSKVKQLGKERVFSKTQGALSLLER